MKRLVKIAIAALFIVAAFLLALPSLLSSSAVKSRIEAQLSELTGRPVVLRGGTSISLRPYMGVAYSDLAIDEREGQKPLLTLDGLEARVGLLSALWGSAQLSEVRLIRPRLFLRVDKDGRRNWFATGGPITRRISAEDPASLEPLSLGNLEIEDGIVEFVDERSGVRHMASGVTGNIDWPTTASGASTTLALIWRGEAVQLVASVENLMESMRGGQSGIDLQIASKPATMSFTGALDTRSDIMAKGDLTFASPSPRRFLEWLESPIDASVLVGSFSVSGAVVVEGDRLSFEDATSTIGERQARGRLQFRRSDSAVLSMNGTLAFDSIELPPPLQLLAVKDDDDGLSDVAPRRFDDVEVDLRLSATNASVGPLELENAAGTVLIQDGVVNFDVGHSDALGGRMTGTLKLSGGRNAVLGTNLSFADIDLVQLSQLLGEPSVSLSGTGSLSVRLDSKAENLSRLVRHLNGEIRIDGLAGQLSGLDLDLLAAAAPLTEKPQSEQLLQGDTPFDEISADLTIANGVALIDASRLSSEGYDVILGGRMDLVQQSIALRGDLIIPSDEDTGDETQNVWKQPFFIGGTSSAPLFIPLPSILETKTPETDNDS